MIESVRDVFPYLLLMAASAITADAVWDVLRIRRRRLLRREADDNLEADFMVAWHLTTQQLPEDPYVALLNSPFRHLFSFLSEMNSNRVGRSLTTTVKSTEPTPGGSKMATVTIQFDTSEDISGLIAALSGGSAPAAPAEAAKPAATKTAKAAAKPAAAAEADDAPAAAEGPTLDDAIERATTLVSEGKAAQVKAALTSVGAKRVSELTDKTIGGFMDALDMA